MMAKTAVNVVILIPPAVPDGEAPMYIKKIQTSIMDCVNKPKSTVLNPTVVIALIHWKKAAKNLESLCEFAIEGSKYKNAVPNVSKIKNQ